MTIVRLSCRSRATTVALAIALASAGSACSSFRVVAGPDGKTAHVVNAGGFNQKMLACRADDPHRPACLVLEEAQ